MSRIPLLNVLCKGVQKWIKLWTNFRTIYLEQLGFTDSACSPFTKSKERIEKHMQPGNTDFISRNELDKACLFSTWYGLGKLKYLTKKT